VLFVDAGRKISVDDIGDGVLSSEEDIPMSCDVIAFNISIEIMSMPVV